MTEEARADHALIRRIASGDTAAVGELYDRHNRLLFSLILRILGARSEAEEVLQEAFITVWQKADTYDGDRGSPAGWLVGIARNRAIDRLRANKVRQTAVDSAVSDMRVESEPRESPEAAAVLSEEQRAVGRALNELPHDQRALIEDAYFQGLSHSELAARHKLPLGTVKTRIRAGMLTLRQHLSQVGQQ